MAKKSSKSTAGKSTKAKSAAKRVRDPVAIRRRALMASLAGRRLDQAYQEFPAIRALMREEAASELPDALVTREMLDHLESLIAESSHSVALPAPAPAPAPSASPSSTTPKPRGRGVVATAPPSPTSLDLGQAVFNSLVEEAAAPISESIEPKGARRAGLAPVKSTARSARPGLEFTIAPRLFFSTEAVIIVPGFLASTLSDSMPGGKGLIWVDPLLSLRDELGALQLAPYDGTERDADPAVRVGAQGALPLFYDLLRADLEFRRYTTEIFPVDWRKDLEIAAGQLAARLKNRSIALKMPISLIAHSQGALVARRALQILGKTEARKIVKALVLLGPANFGSFSAAFALAGRHSLLPLVQSIAIDPKQGFQTILSSMTGVYQLLPFDKARSTWLQTNDYSAPEFWKQPVDSTRLRNFFGWGATIDSSFLNDRTAVILGDTGTDANPKQTVGGVAYKGNTLEASSAHNVVGDGTVPHACAVLPGTRTFLSKGSEHSRLATYTEVMSAIRDILANRPVGLPIVSSDPKSYL